jgi:hypothetical protein
MFYSWVVTQMADSNAPLCMFSEFTRYFFNAQFEKTTARLNKLREKYYTIIAK